MFFKPAECRPNVAIREDQLKAHSPVSNPATCSSGDSFTKRPALNCCQFSTTPKERIFYNLLFNGITKKSGPLKGIPSASR